MKSPVGSVVQFDITPYTYKITCLIYEIDVCSVSGVIRVVGVGLCDKCNN